MQRALHDLLDTIAGGADHRCRPQGRRLDAASFILLAHPAYKWLVDRETPWAPVMVLAGGARLLVSLIAWQHEYLGGIGGYQLPTWEHIRANFVVGA